MKDKLYKRMTNNLVTYCPEHINGSWIVVKYGPPNEREFIAVGMLKNLAHITAKYLQELENKKMENVLKPFKPHEWVDANCSNCGREMRGAAVRPTFDVKKPTIFCLDCEQEGEK